MVKKVLQPIDEGMMRDDLKKERTKGGIEEVVISMVTTALQEIDKGIMKDAFRTKRTDEQIRG